MKVPRVKNAVLLEAAFAVRKAVFLMDRAVDRALALEGRLTMQQVLLLRFIEARAGVTQRELAGCIDLTEAAVSRQVESLVRRKYVTRRKIPEARRAMALSLTAAGEKELLAATRIGFGAMEGFYGKVPETELRTVRKVFEGIAGAMHETCGPPQFPKARMTSDRIPRN